MENTPNAAVEAVWEQIAALTPGEKLALFQRLEPEAKKIYDTKLAEVMREMKAKGMIRSETLPKRSGHRPKKLVVEGEPVSETIMREWR